MDAASKLTSALRRSFALHAVSRACECVAVGWLAAAIVVAVERVFPARLEAVALEASTNPALPAVAWAAALAGVAAAGAFWLERAPDRAEHARRVDRRLGFDGALVTALDARVGTSAMARALIERVTSRLRRDELARASLPGTPLALVALVAGWALLHASNDLAPRAVPTATEIAATSAASSAARSAAQDAARALRRAPSPGVASPGAASTTDATSSAVTSQPATPDPRASDADSAASSGPRALADRALADRLERFARDGATRAERRSLAADVRAAADDPGRPLEVARSLARARDTLERDAVASSTSADRSLGSGRGGDAPASGTNAAGASRAEHTDPALASVGADGRMIAPRTDGTDPVAVSNAASTGDERGVSTLRWWPVEDDPVVERWVGARRPK